MKKNTLIAGVGLALAIAPSAAVAGEISLDDVILIAEQYEAVVEHVPWSGSWWAFQQGKLAKGYHGDDCFTYNEDDEEFTRVSKPDNDLSPLLKYDLFVERRTGTNPESAYLELKGDDDKDFHHHVYGERKRQYDEDGVSYSWWGHCNGWAAAAVMEREPVSPIVAEGIRFDVADLKGILTESYWGVRADFTGRRYNKPSDEMRAKIDKGQELLDKLGTDDEPPLDDYIAWYEDIYDRTLSEDVRARLTPENFRATLENARDWAKENWEDAYEDIYPHVFHKILVTMIKNRRAGVVFDVSANEEVWNFPAYYFSTDVSFAEDLPGGGKKWNVSTTVYYAHDGVSESILGVNRLSKSYTYTLTTDTGGRPTGGEWTGGSVDNHPDFAWVPTYNPRGEDSGENPKVLYGEILELLAEDHTHGPRDMELQVTAANGDAVKQSDKIGAQETSTWANAVEVTSPVAVSVQTASDTAIVKVRYYENSVNAGWRFATVSRGEMTLLAEVDSGAGLAGSLTLSNGKHHIVAQGLNAAGRLISISELTVQVVSTPTPDPDPDPTPTDDSFEPNNSRAAAAAVAAGTFGDLRCEDDDWFKVDVAQGGALTVRIAFQNSAGDLDMKLYRGSTQLDSSTSTGNSETVSKSGLSAGTYQVRVYGYSGARAPYSMTVTVEGGTDPDPDPDPDPTPTDDSFEPNNSRAAAAALIAGTHAIQVRDADWFKVDLASGERATFRAAFTHADGDIDIKTYDSAGSRIGTSESIADSETLEVRAGTAGTYYVQVYGYNGAQNDVALTVTFEGGTPDPGQPPEPSPTDDSFESNDTRSAATPLAPGTYSAQIAGNDDWYKIDAPSGQRLTVTITFSHSAGDLDMASYSDSGARLNVSQDTRNSETLTVTGGQFVRVYGYSGARGTYSLTIQ